MQLNNNVLVLTHFYAMSVCIMTRTIPLSSNGRNQSGYKLGGVGWDNIKGTFEKRL